MRTHIRSIALASSCAALSAALAACGGAVTPPDPDGIEWPQPEASDAGFAKPPYDAGRDAFDAGDVDAHVVDASYGDVNLGDVFDAATQCPAPPAQQGAPACGAPACGNGHVDTCSTTTTTCCPGPGPLCGPPPYPGDAGCVTTETPVAEACDGADLGGATCASLGYAGGTLLCGSDCTFDTSGCMPCTTGSGVAACKRLGDDEGATSVGLAVRDDGTPEIGVSWVTSNDDGTNLRATGALRFARLGADLVSHGTTPCFGPDDALSTSVAATANGWLVAVATFTGSLQIFSLDTTGATRGAVHAVSAPNAQLPRLTARAGGATLLTWVTAGGFWETLLDDTGSEVAPETLISRENVDPDLCSATSTGDGFLVGYRDMSGGGGGDGIRVARVELDGRISGVHHDFGTTSEYPQLAWTGSEGRLTYAEFGSSTGVRWARLDHAGAAIGGPVAIGSVPQYYDPVPITALGGDTVALLEGYTGTTGVASHLDVVRLGATGTPVAAPLPVSKTPGTQFGMRFARFGGGVVAAWVLQPTQGAGNYVRGRGIAMARVTP